MSQQGTECAWEIQKELEWFEKCLTIVLLLSAQEQWEMRQRIQSLREVGWIKPQGLLAGMAGWTPGQVDQLREQGGLPECEGWSGRGLVKGSLVTQNTLEGQLSPSHVQEL